MRGVHSATAVFLFVCLMHIINTSSDLGGNVVTSIQLCKFWGIGAAYLCVHALRASADSNAIFACHGGIWK